MCNIEVKDCAGYTALLLASKYGRLSVVKYLIEECSCNLDAIKDGDTALHCASWGGHLDVVQYLFGKLHFNVNEKNGYGHTALHLASKHGHLPIVKYLIEKENCDVEIKDDNDHTALHRASSFGHLDVVKYLIEECYAKVTDEIIEDIKSGRIKNKKIATYLLSKHDDENQ